MTYSKNTKRSPRIRDVKTISRMSFV